MAKEIKMQPTLLHVATEKDIVYTPKELALDVITHFRPSGLCLDPCRGNGSFYNLLPVTSRDWCEIQEGRDFFAWKTKVDWIVSNPPYSNLLAWIRHSFNVAHDIVYIMPSHRVFASAKFLDDVFSWGGIVHIRRYGTGSQWGFPFGHALTAVHYQRDYRKATTWSRYKTTPAHDPR